MRLLHDFQITVEKSAIPDFRSFFKGKKPARQPVSPEGSLRARNIDVGSSPIRDERGFSLIDALIAVVLFVGGILAYGTFTGGVMDRNSSNEMTSVAVGLAEERIEELKTKVGTTTIGDADDTTVTTTIGGVTYTVTTDVSNGGVGNLVEVNVVVTWTDNLPSTYTLNTRIHQS